MCVCERREGEGDWRERERERERERVREREREVFHISRENAPLHSTKMYILQFANTLATLPA